MFVSGDGFIALIVGISLIIATLLSSGGNRRTK